MIRRSADPAALLTGSPTASALAGATAATVFAVAVQLTGPAAALPALGAVAAFALAVAAFVRVPHLAAAGLVATLCAQPALRHFGGPAFAPLEDVVVAAAVAAALVHRLRAGRAAAPIDGWLAAGVLLLMGLYVLNPAGEHDEAWFFAARLVLESFALFLAAQSLPAPERTWRWTVGALIASCCAIALYGLVQQRLGYVRLVEEFGYTYGVEVRQTASGSLRSFGTLEDPFSYALLLMLGLAALLVAVRRRGWVVCATLLVTAGLAASFVRSAAVVATGLLVVALVRVGRKAVAAALAVALLLSAVTVLATVPQTSATASGDPMEFLLTLNGRTKGWSALLPTPEAWVAGRGAGDVGTGASRAAAESGDRPAGAAPIVTDAEFQRRNVDSSYFGTVADVGLVGLGVLLAIIARTAVLALRGARAGSRPAWLVLAAGVVALLDAITRASLMSVPAGYVAMWVVGISLAAAQAERLRAEAATPPVHHAAISASRR